LALNPIEGFETTSSAHPFPGGHISGSPLFFQKMNHTRGPELAVQFRIFAFKTRITQIDLMLFAFVADLFLVVFRAAAHWRTPSYGFFPY
jgi:hypothetical protein